MTCPSIEDHLEHIWQVLDAISVVDVKVHPSKCVFGALEVPYSGHILSAKGVSPMEAKVKTIV